MSLPVPPASELPPSARRVAEELARRGHGGQVRILSDSARTAAEAAAALGVHQRQIVKSLVFRGRESGEPIVVLLGGTSCVDTARLTQVVGEAVRRADPAWVREVSGFAIGGVPPVGHRNPLDTVADGGLLGEAELWAAAGTPHAVFPLSGEELVSLTGAQVAEVAVAAEG